ncbi:hypothetical protein R1flu_005432 [Riccia fluitans]|uniref:HIT-type domain-containing protein n=1 Tax=Riccia fluitans TaxID=41844 RepID=A0ABD1YTT8_9MARC
MEVSTSSTVHGGSETRVICKVCQKQFSKYTCPRCNLRYCSLPCYKGHSLRCTESFMRENVIEEMRDIQATDETKEKTLQMLKRIHFDEAGRSIFEDESFAADESQESLDSDDAEGSFFSERTIQCIMEGEVPTLEELTETEREHFMRYLATGEGSRLIQPWNPWWLNPLAKNVSVSKQGSSLIQSLDSSPDSSSSPSGMAANDELMEVSPSEVPAPPSKPLPSVRELTLKEPSPLLAVHLAEVVYAYCFTLRYYNGDWRSDPVEATSVFLSVSHVVGQAALPESVCEAFHEALQTVCSPVFKHAGGLPLGLGLLDDCVAVLRLGRPCVICALSDLHNMLQNAKQEFYSESGPGEQSGTARLQELKPSSSIASSSGKSKTRGRRSVMPVNLVVGQGSRKKDLRKIEAGMRKVFFLMCWANDQVDEDFSSLAALVETEKARTAETLEPANKTGPHSKAALIDLLRNSEGVLSTLGHQAPTRLLHKLKDSTPAERGSRHLS